MSFHIISLLDNNGKVFFPYSKLDFVNSCIMFQHYKTLVKGEKNVIDYIITHRCREVYVSPCHIVIINKYSDDVVRKVLNLTIEVSYSFITPNYQLINMLPYFTIYAIQMHVLRSRGGRITFTTYDLFDELKVKKCVNIAGKMSYYIRTVLTKYGVKIINKRSRGSRYALTCKDTLWTLCEKLLQPYEIVRRLGGYYHGSLYGYARTNYHI